MVADISEQFAKLKDKVLKKQQSSQKRKHSQWRL